MLNALQSPDFRNPDMKFIATVVLNRIPELDLLFPDKIQIG